MARPLRWVRFISILVCVAMPAISRGQDRANDSTLEPSSDARAGEPFGVGYITIDVPPTGRIQPPTVTEKNGRAFYSAFVLEPYPELTWDVLKRPENVLDQERRMKVFFLFKGAEPLDITVYTPRPTQRRIEVNNVRNSRHAFLLKRWWSSFTTSRPAAATDDYPRLVDDYLTAMLARRLGLDANSPDRYPMWVNNELDHAIGLLTGAESVRAAMQKDTMLSHESGAGKATEELPKPVALPPVDFPEPAADVQIEPIAQHVPHECFYIRFGSFENFQWFRLRLDQWGGDLRTAVAYRGLDYGIDARIQQQIALRETALAKLLGSRVIADVAIVGHDTFLREGASIGILFQAKSNLALTAAVHRQRQEALMNHPDASEGMVRIAGHDVSYLSTPDNRIRSYYAIDGDFHLVATSGTLVKRFFEAGDDQRSLGSSREFRSARTRMPLSRDDTAFVYLSDEFFRVLVSPQYRIEMTRRLRAATDIDLFQMARLAARNEGQPSNSIEELANGGFLPKGFGRQPDGSQLVHTQDGVAWDSMRGAAGSFTPIPDIEIDHATPAEVRAYEQFAMFYRAQWQRMDPVMVGIKRLTEAPKNEERIALDIHITPVAQQHYGMLAGMLAPPRVTRLAPVEGNLISLEIAARDLGDHLFAGLRNDSVPFEVHEDGAMPHVEDKNVRAYLGADRNSSLMRLFLGQASFDAQGFAPPGPNVVPGLWQRQDDRFHLVSLHRDVLVDVMPQLKIVDAPRKAQLRLHVGDLASSKLSDLLNAYGYAQARRISNGNLAFLHTVSNQLGVNPKDARQAAEGLLGAKLVCPIGGDYGLEARNNEFPTWASTIPPSDKRPAAPKEFVAPPLRWFRGLELEFSLDRNELSVHAELQVQREE